MRLFKRKVALATNQEQFDYQTEVFLEQYGFPSDDEHRALYGMFVQNSDSKDDTIDTDLIAKQIRKAKAIRCAFYLIKPDMRPKKETTDATLAPASEDVVQKA